MYYLLGYDGIKGGNALSGIQRVTDNVDFSCKVLDTTDNTVEQLSKRELEQILRSNPQITIEGVKHNNGKITHIYADNGHDVIQDGYFTVQVEYITFRGEYASVKVYRKGINHVAYKFDTPHLNGHKWKLRGVHVSYSGVEIMMEAQGGFYFWEIHVINERGDVTVVIEPENEDYKRGGMIRDINKSELERWIEKWKEYHNDYFAEKRGGIKEMLMRAPIGTKIGIKYTDRADGETERERYLFDGYDELNRAEDGTWKYSGDRLFPIRDGGSDYAMNILDVATCGVLKYQLSISNGR